MRRSPRTRLFAASVAMVATLGLAACGDDDDDTTSSTDVDVTLSTEDTEITVTDDTEVSVTVGDTIDTTDIGDTADTGDTTDSSTPTSGGGEVGSQDDYLTVARGQLPLEDEDIRDCVAEALVSDEIYEAIEDAGMTVDTFESDGPGALGLDQAAAEALGDDLAGCGDIASQFAADADNARLQCLQENMDEEQIADALAFEILEVEEPADLQAAEDAVDACADAGTTTTTS